MGSLPKTKKSNIPKSIHEMSKEMLQETLKKKKECNMKALEIVEKLCETQIDEDWFLTNLQFINQCHFDDVTIERAISKMCGYPLCDQELSKVPAQQYHISTRYNKVFDITERKNFCSSSCYKSATHVKVQLFTSPLWLRDKEIIPKFTVLKSSKSLISEKIVFFPDKIKLEPENIKETDSGNNKVTLNENINTLDEKSSNLNIFNSKREPNNKTETDILENIRSHCKITESSLNEKILNKAADGDMIKNKVENNIITQKQIIKNPMNNFKVENLDKQRNKEVTNKITSKIIKEDSANKYKAEKTQTKLKNQLSDAITKIENSIFEWFSLDTIFYLYKKQKLKELFQEKSIKIEELLNKKQSIPDFNEKINKMIQLYGLLDTDLFNSNENKMKLKPLPDYPSLKEEGKSLEIKVRAFYQGNLEVTMPCKEVKKEQKETKTNSNPIYLPLIDAHAQVTLRKKIVLDKLNKVLPELMKMFSSDFILKMSEIRSLVSTFSFSAHNITFKPTEWNLIGVIIIKLLCLRDKDLNSLMKSESSKSQMLIILKSYELQKDYIDDLLLRLTVNENLLEKLKMK